MNPYGISDKAMEAIRRRLTIILKKTSHSDIIIREIQPDGWSFDGSHITLYNQKNSIYVGAAKTLVEDCNVKTDILPPISTIDDEIYKTISILEKDGFSVEDRNPILHEASAAIMNLMEDA